MNLATHASLQDALLDVATASERVVVAQIPLRGDRLLAVPLALLDTHACVVVAAQTRHAILSAARRAACRVGDDALVSYHTLYDVSPRREATRLHYCAPGSTIARVAAHGAMGDGEIALVIDQAYQARADQLMLLTAARAAIERGARLRVVLLGALLDTESLSGYVAACTRARCALVAWRDDGGAEEVDGSTIEAAIAEHGGDTRLVAILPTKAAVDELARVVRLRFRDWTVIALHSRSSPHVRQLAATFQGPMVLATTEVPTGLSRIDVVVDDGMVHRSRGVDGVTRPTSVAPSTIAESAERAGLASRTYVRCAPVSTAMFPRSGLEAGGLARVLLRLAADGLAMDEAHFLYEPARELREHDLALLAALGAIDPSGAPTPIASAMAELPLRPGLARMLVEAIAQGVARSMLKIAAVLEIGDLRASNDLWREHTGECGREDACDLFAVLELFELAERTKRGRLRRVGIDPQAFSYARREYERLVRVLRLPVDTCTGTDRRAAVVRSCIAGLVQGFERTRRERDTGEYTYRGVDGHARRLLPWSVVGGSRWPRWVVGEALDRRLHGSANGDLHWVTAATAVDTDPKRGENP